MLGQFGEEINIVSLEWLPAHGRPVE
jgi:hypothetical protein